MVDKVINISKMNKAEVLSALYNAAKPQGMGYLHYDPTKMSVKEAAYIIEESPTTYFDYLKGRVLKVDLNDEQLDFWAYDRDNGTAAAANALSKITGYQGVSDKEDSSTLHLNKEIQNVWD